jgi:hypothetical protein
MMMCLKISRISWVPDKEDNWIDLAGYAACGWDCVEREETGLKTPPASQASNHPDSPY